MTTTPAIIFLIIGLIAGWLAGVAIKGRGFGLAIHIIAGITGAFIGAWLPARLGPGSGGLGGEIINAFIGAAILLFGANASPKNEPADQRPNKQLSRVNPGGN
jgi:uncharacterized membrane protein YeaQ/YmgE (transglycosylase-associated protein family)